MSSTKWSSHLFIMAPRVHMCSWAAVLLLGDEPTFLGCPSLWGWAFPVWGSCFSARASGPIYISIYSDCASWVWA